MPEQLPLFEMREPTAAERLHQRLDQQRRDQVLVILVEMTRAALSPPAAKRQEADRDEQ